MSNDSPIPCFWYSKGTVADKATTTLPHADSSLNRSGLLLVLGQTAFFFYLLQGHLLLLAAWSLGVSHQRGLPETFIATAGVIGLLYPCCRWYRRYKTTHPNGWVRYV